MKRKHLTETPVCPRERLVIISYTTGLSFALERIGPLAPIIITVFYLFVLYLFALPNTLKTRLLVFTVNPSSNHLSTPSAPCWVQHSYLSKVLRYTPYTCGSSMLAWDLRLLGSAFSWVCTIPM
jgi:hypothetical protein